MDPINPNTETPTPAVDTRVSDPVVLFKVKTADVDETYQCVFDFNVNKVVTRHLGVNPMMQGLDTALSHPDGIEVLLWAVLTQMGQSHDVPKDQRHITIKRVTGWLADDKYGPRIYMDGVRVISKCYNNYLPPTLLDDSEGENSNPPQ